LRLKLGHAELPQQKAPRVCQAFLIFRFAAADTVTAAVINPQQDRFTAGSRRLQARRHLAQHPRVNARIVDAGSEQNRGIRRVVFYVVECAHLIERLKAFLRLRTAEFRNVRLAVVGGFETQGVFQTDVDDSGAEEVRPLGNTCLSLN
jgi:hypothetical protein